MSLIKRKKRCPNCFSETKALPCEVCGFSRSDRENDEDLLPRGTRLLKGRYTVGGLIGRGGFGATYSAFDTKNEKVTAIKEYFPASLSFRQRSTHMISALNEKNAVVFDNGLESFFNESEQVSRFNGNPNIVNVYDCFLENGTAYYAMEYLRGITLERYVSENGALSAGQTVYLARRLSLALTVIHSAGLLHRDIAPDNIMLCGDGKVKLLDFGSARKLSEKTSLTVMIKTGFTSAEQYSSFGKFGAWTDIYSVGAVMFYAATGKAPDSVYSRMENDNGFSEALSGISAPLREMIGKAACIEPEKRFGSAPELTAALEKLNITEEKIPVTVNANLSNTSAAAKRKIRPAPIIAAASAVILTAALAAVFPADADSSAPVDNPVTAENNAAAENTAAQKVYNTADNLNEDTLTISFDGEYAGDMAPCGYIPTETLKGFGGDVKITLEVSPYSVKDSFLYGFRPADASGECVLQYLSGAGTPLADPDGFIHLDLKNTRYVFVISREGIERLNSHLCFLAYGAVINSAELSPGEARKPFTFNKYRDYLTHELTEENGKKIYSADITHYIKNEYGHNVTQYVPVKPLLELGGDVLVTVSFEHEKNSYKNEQLFSVDWNAKNRTKYIRANEKQDALGRELVKYYADGGMIRADLSLSECSFILPRAEIEKMVGGFTFAGENMIMKHVRIESAA